MEGFQKWIKLLEMRYAFRTHINQWLHENPTQRPSMNYISSYYCIGQAICATAETKRKVCFAQLQNQVLKLFPYLPQDFKEFHEVSFAVSSDLGLCGIQKEESRIQSWTSSGSNGPSKCTFLALPLL